MDLSKFLVGELKNRKDRFKLVIDDPEFINTSFWYLPESVRKLDPASEAYRNKLHSVYNIFTTKYSDLTIVYFIQVPPKIKEGMMKAGTMMLGYQPMRQWPNFFRFVTQNSGMMEEDVVFMLDEIERLGADL